MHTEPRNGASIDRIYAHTNEGPEQPGGANGLAHYLLNNGPDGGGYQVVDGDVLVRIASDDTIVWGAGGDNTHSLHIVFEGYANQTPQQWDDAFSRGELDRAVQQVATWCLAYNVPPVRVRPGAPGQAPTDRGIAEHADDHSPNSQGHTDPGPYFPIDTFIARVQAEIAARHRTAVFFAWCAAIEKHPLEPGTTSWEVTMLKQALNSIGEGPGNEAPFYGSKLAACVVAFKKKHNVGNVSPGFGGVALKALLAVLAAKK